MYIVIVYIHNLYICNLYEFEWFFVKKKKIKPAILVSYMSVCFIGRAAKMCL